MQSLSLAVEDDCASHRSPSLGCSGGGQASVATFASCREHLQVREAVVAVVLVAVVNVELRTLCRN